MASRNAALPADESRFVGDSDRSADEANGAGVDLFASGPPGGVAWVHQEDEGYAGRGFGVGAQASEGVGAMSEKNMGSSIDDFMKEEGIFEEAQAQAVKEVVAWQLAEAMRERKISKNKMAIMLKTSRTQVDRLLDPTSDITLKSLQRAAGMVGRRVSIELV
jgi:hypothetical protein